MTRAPTNGETIPFDASALSKAIGVRVRELRKNAGLTQLDLAQRLDTQQSQIFEIETGGANPTIRTLARLSEVFGVDVVDLLPASRSEPPSEAALRSAHGLLEKLSSQLEERRLQEDRRMQHEAQLLSEMKILTNLQTSLEKSLGSSDTTARSRPPAPPPAATAVPRNKAKR